MARRVGQRWASHIVGASAVLLAWGAGAAGCGRTDLDPADLGLGESREPTILTDAATEDAPPDAQPDVPLDAPPDSCIPTEEECNGLDDDCDGVVDDLPPIPCEGGGSQYCVAGAYSDCPTQCDVCVPGAESICFVSYCYFWGVRTCNSDGKSWSGCEEEPPPSPCRSIAQDHQKSRQLEECCVEQGYCCKDDFDLDEDGDRSDYVGACEETTCDG